MKINYVDWDYYSYYSWNSINILWNIEGRLGRFSTAENNWDIYSSTDCNQCHIPQPFLSISSPLSHSISAQMRAKPQGEDAGNPQRKGPRGTESERISHSWLACVATFSSRQKLQPGCQKKTMQTNYQREGGMLNVPHSSYLNKNRWKGEESGKRSEWRA